MMRSHLIAVALSLALFSAQDAQAGKLLDHLKSKGSVNIGKFTVTLLKPSEFPNVQNTLKSKGLDLDKIDLAITVLHHVKGSPMLTVVAGKRGNNGCLVEYVMDTNPKAQPGRVYGKCLAFKAKEIKARLNEIRMKVLKRISQIIDSLRGKVEPLLKKIVGDGLKVLNH